MANWCENILQIHGSKQARQSFKTKAKGDDTDLSITALHKMPKHTNEYIWLMTNFDLPSDFEAEVDETDSSLTYWFFTQDVPPFKWLKKVSIKFSRLWFELDYLDDEGERYFVRKVHVEHGMVKRVASHPYSSV